MVIIVSRYCILLLVLLPVCCLGRTSRGLWDQLPVQGNNLYASGDNYMRTNIKKRTVAVNNIDKIKILEGDKGFRGKILKMGMQKTKKKEIIKNSKRTSPRHSKSLKHILSKIKRAKTTKVKKRENRPR
jgi:hypothetical protein